MRKTIGILTAFLITGCLFPVAQNLRSIIQSHNDYTLTGVTESFDAMSLKKYIPIEAPLFVEFGVDSCLVAEFNRGNERYAIETYSFLNPRGALGTYFITTLPDSRTFDIGYHARKNNTTVQFVKGHYLITVRPLNESRMEGAVELANIFAKRIMAGPIKPDLYQTIPKANLVKNSEFFFNGPRAFQQRFSAELGRALNIALSINGVAAKYTVDHSEVELIKIRTQGRRESLDTVDSYLKTRRDRPILISPNILSYKTVIEQDKSEVYIAESGDIVYFMPGGDQTGKARSFFEYILRGGK